MKSDCAMFTQTKTACLCDELDHHPLMSVERAYFTDGSFSCYISFFVYIFCRLLSFSQKLNMTFQDFHNIQSGHNVTVELFKYGLFWKLLKNFGFHRNQCKMQIVYGYATQS